MKKSPWLYLFVIALIVDLAGVLVPNETLQFFSKPLIVVFLFIYFITSTRHIVNPLKVWVMLALFFSWMGDVLLMFSDKGSQYFLLGLSAFLLAHICYIIFFNRVRASELIIGRWWLLLIVAFYYGAMITFLTPYLSEDMSMPVKIYAAMISIMLVMAMHILYLKNKKAGALMAAGALLFVISDSVLAFNKFYSAFEPAGFIIMITYGMAQLLIAEGGIRHLSSAAKR